MHGVSAHCYAFVSIISVRGARCRAKALASDDKDMLSANFANGVQRECQTSRTFRRFEIRAGEDDQFYYLSRERTRAVGTSLPTRNFAGGR